jgi:hypothetical protein
MSVQGRRVCRVGAVFRELAKHNTGGTQVRPQGEPGVRSENSWGWMCALGSWAARPRPHE